MGADAAPPMFAALAILATLALTLYFTVDKMMTKLVFWQKSEETEEAK